MEDDGLRNYLNGFILIVGIAVGYATLTAPPNEPMPIAYGFGYAFAALFLPFLTLLFTRGMRAKKRFSIFVVAYAVIQTIVIIADCCL